MQAVPSPNPALSETPSREDARTKILEATHQLVGDHGFDATSIREIAKASGTNPALIYYYFGSKEGLFGELANLNADRCAEVLRDAATLEGTTRERVGHFLTNWMLVVGQRATSYGPWFRQTLHSPGEPGDMLRSRVAGNIRLLANILEDGMRRKDLREIVGDPMPIAAGIMLSVAGLAMELILKQDQSGVDLTTAQNRKAFIDRMLDVWFSGLEAR